MRVKIVLLSAEGRAAAEIAERLDCTGCRSEMWLGHPVDDHEQAERLRAGDERVGVGEGPEARVHVGVVRMS